MQCVDCPSTPFAHRQVVLIIPKRLRVHTRFDWKLLGKLSSFAAPRQTPWIVKQKEAEEESRLV